MKVLNIVFLGLEWDRVIKPIKEYQPQKLIIFQQEPSLIPKGYDDIAKASADLANKLVKKIDFLVDSEIVHVDFTDYKACLLKIQEVVKTHYNEFDEIIINVSAGTKIINIAAMVVSQFYPCKIVYSVPKAYNISGLKTDTHSKGVLDIKEIKPFNLSPLIDFKLIEEKIINQLSKNELSLTKLTRKLYGKIDDYELLKKKNLLLYHLNKMTKKNLIEVNSEGRESIIKLSDLGYFVKELIK